MTPGKSYRLSGTFSGTGDAFYANSCGTFEEVTAKNPFKPYTPPTKNSPRNAGQRAQAELRKAKNGAISSVQAPFKAAKTSIETRMNNDIAKVDVNVIRGARIGYHAREERAARKRGDDVKAQEQGSKKRVTSFFVCQFWFC